MLVADGTRPAGTAPPGPRSVPWPSAFLPEPGARAWCETGASTRCRSDYDHDHVESASSIRSQGHAVRGGRRGGYEPRKSHVTRNSRPVAVVLSTADLESIEETVAILSDPAAVEAIELGRVAVANGDAATLDEMEALREQLRRSTA